MKKKLHIYLTLIFLLTLSSTVFASHYRSGSITWREVSPRVVEFTVTTSWRSDFVENVYLNYGSTVTDEQETSNLIVSDVNGVATRVQKIVVTYPDLGPYTVSWTSCCRIDGLSGGGSSGNMVLSTIVDLTGGNKNSPVCSLPATVNLPIGATAATFQVPANDLDGDVLSYRLATPTELGGNQPAGFSIDATTGLATVNTSIANYIAGQLYMAGIVVSDGKTSVFVDFLIAITQPSTPPEFLYGPTPVNASVIVVTPGQNVNFQVSARDVDAGGIVSSLFATGIPGGASSPNVSGNPAISTFNWTPTSSDLGSYVLNFVAQDNVGVQVFSSVTIQVSLKPRFDVPPTPAEGVHNVYTPGQTITFPVQASDPDPVDVVRIVDVKGKDMMGQEISLYSNASFSVLPSLAANPTSGTFSWTTQATNWGHKHIYFWAEDSYGDRTRHEVNVLINTNPSFTSTPPTAIVKVADVYSYDVVANDVDIAYGDILDLYAVGAPTWLTLTDNGNGSAKLTGTPRLADVGTFTFKIEAHDINHHDNIGGIPFQNISITVSANAAPIISTISDQSTCPNTAVSNLAFTISDAETAAGSLTITATSSNPGLLPDANIVFGGSGANRTVSLTSVLGEKGTSSVVVTVDDGQGGTAISTFIFTVEDKIAPVVATKNITVNLGADGQVVLTPEMINDGSTDNCGISSMSLDRTTFSCADLGHTVLFTDMGAVSQITSQGGGYNPNTNEFWYSEYGTNEVKIYNTSHQFVRSFNAPISDNRQIWIEKSSSDYYTANWLSHTVNRIDINGTVIWSYDMGTLATAVTSNDSYVFAFGNLDNKIVLLDKKTGVFVKNLTLPGFVRTFGGLVYANGIIYISGTEYSGFSTIPENGSAIHSFDANTGAYISSVATAQASYNTVFDGETIWIGGSVYGKINGYKVSTGKKVVLTVTDAAGNTTTGIARITVKDNQLPVINTNGDKNVNTDLNVCGASVVVTATATDNCTVGLPTGVRSDALALTAAYPVGTTTIAWNVTDANNNNALAVTQTIVVTDIQKPVVLTKNITVQLDAAGTATIVAADINDGSTDACGVSLLELDITSFSCANIGVNTVTLKVTDNNGNIATQTAIVTVEDKIAPVPTIILLADVTAECSVTSLVAPTATDNCVGVVAVTNNAVFPITLQGTTVVTWKYEDQNGNTSTQVQNIVIKDVTAPFPAVLLGSVTLTPTPGSTNGWSPYVWSFVDPLPIGATVIGIDIDYTAVDQGGGGTGDNSNLFVSGQYIGSGQLFHTPNSFNLSYSGLVSAYNYGGSNSLEMKFTGYPGWQAKWLGGTIKIRYTINQLPVISSECSVTSLVAPVPADNCAGVVIVTNNAVFPITSQGTTVVTWTYDDQNGNTSTQVQDVVIQDVTAPVVVTNGDKNVNTDLNVCGASVVVTATATDNCTVGLPTGVRSDALALTAAYPVGTTTIAWNVTDANNNNSLTVTQTIVVTDIQKPVVLTKNITVQLYAVGNATITPADVDNGSTDACGVSLLELDITSFTCANIGVNTVTLKVTDNNGNIASLTATVTVEDKIAPVVVTKNITVQLNAAGTTTIVAADVNNGSTDACGISLLELDKTSFTCANVGANTVTLKVTDVNGNVASQTATVTVEDKITPVVVTKNITVQLNAAGTTTIVAADVNNGSTDACGISLLELDKTSFTCATVGANTVTLKVTDVNGNVANQSATVTVQDVTGPVITCPENITVNNDPGVCTANVTIPAGGNTPPNILLVAANDQTWAAEVKSKLMATGAFNSVDLFDAISETPSTTLLANYKGVLLWTDNTANNPTLLGDNLVNYIDNGGGVVSMVFDIASAPILGAFNTDAYRCLVPDSQTPRSTESLGTIYDAAHPIMSGVVSFSGGTSSYRSNSNTLATGAIKIADWTDGLPLVVVKENVGLSKVRRADLNFFPPSSDSRDDFWDAATDGDLLMKNALLWVTGSTSGAGGVAASDGCSNTITITNNITGTNDASGVYPVGTTNVVWTATDASGNSSSCTQTVTVVDNEVPVVVTKNITVQLNAAGTASIVAADVNNGSTDACGISLLELDKTSFTCANVGANTVTLKVTDVNGNVASLTVIVTVEDKIAPVVVTKNITVQLNAAGTATIVAADVNNGSTDACGISLLALDKTSFTCANVGANTVTLKVTDVNGNVASLTATVTVEEKIAPVVVTKNITVQLNAAGTATIVTADINNGSTDACGISLLALDKTSFTCPNVGANTVTLKVTDVNGNVASQTAAVTVEDKIAPIVVTKNITVQLNAAGTAIIVVSDINNGSTDACGISLVTLDKTSFTCANIGANTVTLKVIDNNGNVATKTAIVTVEDKIAPVVIVKNITVQLDASSNILIAATDVNNGSTDNCGISLLELDKTSFSCADVGENTVTLKVTDNNGNVSTKTAVVTVENTQPNLIRKHFDDVIFFDNSSKAFVTFSWYKNGVLVSSQTAQYFKDNGVLNGEYYAIATKVDGTVVTTCPLTFSASIVDEYLKIAPNPVKSNVSYQIITNVDSAKLQNARITVFNILGVLVNDKMVDGITTVMIAPNMEGVYVVRMTLANGKYFTKNLLVKN